MSWMSANMRMETTSNGSVGAALGRMIDGEGLVLQKLSRNGTAFIEIDGSVEVHKLQARQQIIVDTGHLAAMSGTC